MRKLPPRSGTSLGPGLAFAGFGAVYRPRMEMGGSPQRRVKLAPRVLEKLLAGHSTRDGLALHLDALDLVAGLFHVGDGRTESRLKGLGLPDVLVGMFRHEGIPFFR